ncbi:MAG: hypothetical protein ACP5JG_06295, partial [Anaerolineae bacterium]
LREALERHQTYIGAMTSQELRRAIQGPANKGNWSFEPGLVNVLLHDVGADAHPAPEPGALPLLSHALMETWKRRQGRTLTLKGYAEAGGVRGAIAQSAEAVYRDLEPPEQAIARSVFLRLTELGRGENAETTLLTRRRASLDEITAMPDDPGAVKRVVEALAAARLVTLEENAVEVAHEALIREWPALQTWLQEDLEGLRIHRRLTDAGRRWEASGRDTGDLYRGARLAQVEAWVQEAERALTADERAFLDASLAERRRIEEAREAQRRQELAAAQKAADAAQRLAESQQRRAEERGRLLRWLAVAAVLLLVAAIAAALLGRGFRAASLESAALADANATAAAENAAVAATARAAEAQAVAAQEQEAQQRAVAESAQQQEAAQRAAAETAREEALIHARVAESNLLAVQSGRLLEEDYALALLLSAEAYDLLDAPQTRGSMLTALEAYPSLSGLLHTPVNEILSLAFSPDGSRLAAVGIDSVIGDWLYEWDIDRRRWVREPREVSGVAFSWQFHLLDYSPDGDALASGACGEFDDRGECVAGEITLWDAETGEMLNQLKGHAGTVRGVRFDPSSERLASWGGQNVLLWDVGDAVDAKVERELRGHTLPVSAVAFSSDGKSLASVGFDADAPPEEAANAQHYLRLWDIDTGAQLQDIAYSGHGFYSLAFSADGTVLVAGGCNKPTSLQQTSIPGCDEGLVRRWRIDGGEEMLPTIVDHSDYVDRVRFINQDALLLTTGRDNAIILHDVADDTPTAVSVASPKATAFSALSSDEKTLATAWRPPISLWNMDRLQGESLARTSDVLASTAPLPLGGLDLSPDGALVAAGCGDKGIFIWNVAAEELMTRTLDSPAAWRVAFSPDGELLAAGAVDATVRLWDVETGKSVHPPLRGHTGTVTSVAFSPDSALLASSSSSAEDGTFRVSDVTTGELLSVNRPAPGSGVWNVAFSPDGSMVAAAVSLPEGSAVLYDVRDPMAPQELERLPGEGGVTQVAFNPQGTLLAMSTGGLKGRVLLWDLETFEPAVASAIAHDGTPWPLAFSPTGAPWHRGR